MLSLICLWLILSASTISLRYLFWKQATVRHPTSFLIFSIFRANPSLGSQDMRQIIRDMFYRASPLEATPPSPLPLLRNALGVALPARKAPSQTMRPGCLLVSNLYLEFRLVGRFSVSRSLTDAVQEGTGLSPQIHNVSK